MRYLIILHSIGLTDNIFSIKVSVCVFILLGIMDDMSSREKIFREKYSQKKNICERWAEENLLIFKER